jgi:hypothetical protein
LHQYLGAKAEGRKVFTNNRFEEIANKYWQLLRNDPANLAASGVSREVYTKFMKLVYKVLLPLYRESEMSTEIDHEWHSDCSNASELSLHQFSKLLYRIVHQWATHIDLEEYLELLNKIFKRITHRKIVKSTTNEVIMAYPTINVEIVPEDWETDESFRAVAGGNEAALYEPCSKNEEEIDSYEYANIEDENSMTVSKHRKRKL